MYSTPEQKERHYRTIYEIIDETPRIEQKDISTIMGLRPGVVGNRIKEAREKGYLFGPEIRKKSYKNLKEYLCFAACEDSLHSYKIYTNNEKTLHYTLTDGYFDARIVSTEKIHVTDTVLAEGFRSDYYIPSVPDHTWKIAVQIMRKMVDAFDPQKYMPKGYIETHWDESAVWDEKDEILYREFEYNFRKPYSPLIKKHKIYKYTIDAWFEKIHQYCTVFTSYYLDTWRSYYFYIYMIETDYKDFIVELFSQLPATTWFYTVSDKLFIDMCIDRGLKRRGQKDRFEDVLAFFKMINALLDRGIVKSVNRASIDHTWWKKFDYL